MVSTRSSNIHSADPRAATAAAYHGRFPVVPKLRIPPHQSTTSHLPTPDDSPGAVGPEIADGFDLRREMLQERQQQQQQQHAETFAAKAAAPAAAAVAETCTWPLAEYLALLVLKTFGHWGFRVPAGATVVQSAEFGNFRQFIYTVLNRTSTPLNAVTLAMLYLQRLKRCHPQCRSAAVGSSARLLLAAVVISNKYLQDDCYDNKTWASVSGFAVEEVNKMEQELLFFCGYNMHVPGDEFAAFQQRLYAAIQVCTARMHLAAYSETNFNYYHQQNHFVLDTAYQTAAAPAPAATAAPAAVVAHAQHQPLQPRVAVASALPVTRAAQPMYPQRRSTHQQIHPVDHQHHQLRQSAYHHHHDHQHQTYRRHHHEQLPQRRGRQQEAHFYPSPQLSPYAVQFVPLPPSPVSARSSEGNGYNGNGSTAEAVPTAFDDDDDEEDDDDEGAFDRNGVRRGGRTFRAQYNQVRYEQEEPTHSAAQCQSQGASRAYYGHMMRSAQHGSQSFLNLTPPDDQHQQQLQQRHI